MKRCVGIFGLAVLLAGCKGKQPSDSASAAPQPATPTAPMSTPVPTSAQPQPSTTATVGGPRWDWQKFDEENFETQPSQGRVFAVPENASRLRVKLTATSPVDAAAMTRETFKSAKGVVREDRLVRQPCASIGVRQDEATCSLNVKDAVVYVVRDRRALSGDPAAMALLQKKAGARGSILPKMPPDKVHVELSVWACVANCGVLGGPAQ